MVFALFVVSHLWLSLLVRSVHWMMVGINHEGHELDVSALRCDDDAAKIGSMMDEGNEKTYKSGDIIIQEGEKGHGFYVLKSGVLEVWRKGYLLNVLMFPGTIFGEMGDILQRPRTCTVTARNESVVLYVPEKDVRGLIAREPDVAMKIIRTLAQRLDRVTLKLAEAARESEVWSVTRQGEAPEE